MRTSPKSRLVMITPQMATELLAKNTKNRAICHSTVNRIAQSIINNKFIVTNNAIGFDRNDVLTDGQTRLQAIIKANKPVLSFVVTNLEPEARLVVDTGRKRSNANSLQMLGIGIDVKPNGKGRKDYSKLLASVSAYIMLHQRNQFSKLQSYGTLITNDEIVDFVTERQEELMSSVKTVTKLTKDCKYVEDSHMFFIYQMHKFSNTKRITEFINIVCGTELPANQETCPAFKLKRALEENYGKRVGAKYTTKDLLGMVIDASNKFMAKMEMKPHKKLVSRPNDSNIINVQFSGEMNEKAIKFFNTIVQPKKVVLEVN